VKIPKPKEGEDNTTVNVEKKAESELPLPQTLVRIPTEHAPMLQQSSSGGQGNGES
jgi:DASH complex subunit DAD2